jgi:Fe-S oxidoreductase
MAFFDFMRSAKSVIKRENILYYPGCMTRFGQPKIFSNYKSLLSDVGVNFKIIDEMVCCGSPLLSAGYEDDFEDVKKKNLEILKQNGITKIITNCPHCRAVFKERYGLKAEHVLEVLEPLMHKLSSGSREEVSYHDPCLLAKGEARVIEHPRSILKRANFSIVEPSPSRERTFCCGAGGGLKQTNPVISQKIGVRRLGQIKANKVVASCPYCYVHLKECAAGTSKEIVEFSEVIFEG